MLEKLRSPSFLPSCILAGVGFTFLVLAATLPAEQIVALIGGTAVALGLVLARLRRDAADSGPVQRAIVKG